MTSLVFERERKFDVPDGFVVPDLDRIGPSRSETVEVDSTYFDTDDHALLGWGVTLRRREGASDEGWQLKLPGSAGRREVRMPLSEVSGPPGRLVEALSGLAFGRPLVPVANIRTNRRVARLREGDGSVLAEVADDQVHATSYGTEVVVQTWREVEVELTSDDGELEAGLSRLLRKAGARTSSVPSKLARALGDSTLPANRHPGAEAIHDYLHAQVCAIAAGDVLLRLGEDAVHDTRVAVRRLRSTLRTFASSLASAEELDEDLAWFGQSLGEARDQEVMNKRLTAAVAAIPENLVLGPVAADLRETLTSRELLARSALGEVMEDERYRRLLLALRGVEDLAAPWVGPKQVKSPARKARRKAARRLRKAVAGSDDAALHRARKAAKRGRYATELARPLSGSSADRKVKRYKRIQDVLGEHHDSVVAAEALYRLGARAGTTPGQNGFTYGLLVAGQQRARERAEKRARKLA